MNNSAFLDRLRQAVHRAGGQQIVAEKSGIKLRTLAGYCAGESEMRISTLYAVAKATNVTPAWLLGLGMQETACEPKAIDRELLGRITEAIHMAYKTEKVALSPADLGRLAADRYQEIAAAAETEEERSAMVKLIALQMRRMLAERRAEILTGKRQA